MLIACDGQYVAEKALWVRKKELNFFFFLFITHYNGQQR